MIYPEKRGVHELVKSVHEAVTHGSYSWRVASEAPGLQIRPVRLKWDLTSWEGDHARSQFESEEWSEKLSDRSETKNLSVCDQGARHLVVFFSTAPSGEKFI